MLLERARRISEIDSEKVATMKEMTGSTNRIAAALEKNTETLTKVMSKKNDDDTKM